MEKVEKRIVVTLVEGFEEIEAVVPIDLLRRGGLDVTVAGVFAKTVRGGRGIVIECDCLLSQIDWVPAAVVLPGGPGTKNYLQSEELRSLLGAVKAAGGLIGAICAAPGVVLGSWGFLSGHSFTGYPGTERGVGDADFVDRPVVTDRRLVTAKAAGMAEEFAEALLFELAGPQVARLVAEQTFQPWVRMD